MSIEITELQFITDVISKIRQARYKASKAVNIH